MMSSKDYAIAARIFVDWMTFHPSTIKCRTRFAMGCIWFVVEFDNYCFHFTDAHDGQLRRFELVEAWKNNKEETLLSDDEMLEALIETAQDFEVEQMLTKEKV